MLNSAEGRMLNTARTLLLLSLVFVMAGCAASRAFRRGQDALRSNDWDTAVTYFTKAVQANPDNAEYKINLRRAQEEAARMHIERARDLEQKDQLDAALIEYRKSLEMIGTDRIAQAKIGELERKVRERIEATQPKPKIDQLRSQARNFNAPPLLNPGSREPLRLNFNNSSLKDILNFIGTASGINITYDQGFQDKGYTVNLDGVTLEEALQQVLSANGYYYKVTGQRTIVVIPDQPAKHAQYDDLVVRVFFVNHSDATELAQTLNTIMRIPQMPIPPMVQANKTANTITVRGTASVVDVIDRIIKANDKPRAEVLLDIEILEVNRNRVKHYGINLSSYTLNLLFSPELAPPNTTAISAPPPFNLNTISQGVNTADFYLGVPTAVVNFLENDSHTKTLAKPQLRGQEGQALTLNLGAQVPVLATVFGSAAAGGFATIPQSSYNYKDVGVNLAITPRVTYEGEVLLDLNVENNAIGSPVDVGGQSALSFTSRKAHTFLRLREGEPNLLAGLIKQDNSTARSGIPGLGRVPGIRKLFTSNDISDSDTDIVMLITPHVVRDHELTSADVGSIYIGTQTNVGLSGPPPLIAPQPEAAPVPTAQPPVTPPSGIPQPPNMSTGGVPAPPIGSPGGVQPTPTTPTAPPGTSPVPGPLPALPTAPPAAVPAAGQPPTTPPTTPPETPPANPPRDVVPSPATPPAVPGSPSTPTQIIITTPGTELRVAGGPYPVPLSINNASRISVLTLTVTYNPAILRVRGVQDGMFMRQGGVSATFTPKTDNQTGRVDIAIARVADQLGASGTGLIAALVFDAVAPGASAISVSGVAAGPTGAPVPLAFSPVTVTVR
ncbi:MAG TPA: secretin N-terminal domain-containing protein [Vicinamibacterales bacterium]|nr:secretin N-terminal domain-containing protein [Vicinamibacterales bacterium]